MLSGISNKHIYFLLACLICCGCHLPVYTAEEVHAPFLSEKNELHCEASAGINSLDFHVSYAITNKIGLGADYASGFKQKFSNVNFLSTADPTSVGSHRFDFGDVGVGLFKKGRKNFLSECYLYYGAGKIENLYDDSISPIPETSDYYRITLLPSIGTKKENWNFIFSFRTSYIKLTHYRLAGESQTIDGFMTFEPTTTFKMGFKNFKFMLQLGLLAYSNYKFKSDYSIAHVSFGVCIALNSFSKKNKSN